MKRLYIGALVGLLIALTLCGIATVAAGGGHGTYFPAKVFFPFAMILAIRMGVIGPIAILLVFLQWLCYGVLVGKSSRPRFAVLAVASLHVVAVIAALSIATDTFLPHLYTPSAPHLHLNVYNQL
jgi:hypothetical protein